MSQQEIYQHFMDWLKQTWWGLPEADELVPLIMAQYTPEEASPLTGMPFSESMHSRFSATSLEELAKMKQMDPAELGKRLDALAKKGLVYRIVEGDTVHYSLNDHFFAGRAEGWHGRTDERSKTIAPLMNQYYYHGMYDQYNYTLSKAK